MLEHRVHLSIEDWADVEFRCAVESAWELVQHGPLDADSIGAASHLQLLLRANGYPYAVVDVHRSVDEALAHVAHFEVSRDPANHGATAQPAPATR